MHPHRKLNSRDSLFFGWKGIKISAIHTNQNLEAHCSCNQSVCGMRSDCALTSFLSIISVSCLFRHLHVKVSPSHHWLLCMDKQVPQAHNHKPVKQKFLFIWNHLFRKIQLTRNATVILCSFVGMCVFAQKSACCTCVGQRLLSPEICLWRHLGVASLQRVLDRITHYRDSLQRDFIYIISSSCFSHSLSCYVLKLTACTNIMLKYSLVNTWGKKTPFTQWSFTQFAFSLPLNIEANCENQLYSV